MVMIKLLIYLIFVVFCLRQNSQVPDLTYNNYPLVLALYIFLANPNMNKNVSMREIS